MRFALIFTLFLAKSIFSQDIAESDYLTLEEARAISPDSVKALRLTKKKLSEIPEEIYQFKNLRALDLSRNRISQINPGSLNVFTQLEILNLGKNRLALFPIDICSMPSLTHLSVNDNIISNIPTCIGYSTKLQHLDIFNTRIGTFPEELSLLTDLKSLDARGMLYSPVFQEFWTKNLPSTEIKFDLPCNCID
jgi:Leucine-rich repeat (LRR) protein